MGIRLEADGERLRYAPRSALTPDLAEQMKAHKGGLLAILGCAPCPACGCAIGWVEASGPVTCANCRKRPDGAEKMLIVNLPEGNQWRIYEAELQDAIRQRSVQQPAAQDQA